MQTIGRELFTKYILYNFCIYKIYRGYSVIPSGKINSPWTNAKQNKNTYE